MVVSRGSIHACKALASTNVRITLIDKRNFNLCQTLLYQISKGLVSRGDFATPLRELVGNQHNAQVLLYEVTQITPEGQQIVFNKKVYSYDNLLLNKGSGSTFFDKEKWRTFAHENPGTRRRDSSAIVDGYRTGRTNPVAQCPSVSANRSDRGSWTHRLRDSRSGIGTDALGSQK